MRKTISSVLALACCGMAKPLATMREAVAQALRNAPEVQEYHATYDAAKARRSSAWGAALPSAELFGSHTEQFHGSGITPGTPLSRTNQAGLTASIPLVQPEGWLRARAASQTLEAASIERRSRLANLAYNTSVAWIEFVGIQHRLALAQARTASSLRSFEGVRMRTAAGDLTQIDLRQAQSSVLSSKAAETSLRGDSLKASEAIYLLCGEYPQSQVEFPDSLLSLSVGSQNLLETASIKTARLLSESAASGEFAARLGVLPTLHFLWSTSYALDNSTSERPWDHRGELRLSVGIPPSPGAIGSARAAMRIADSRYRAALRIGASRLRMALHVYEQSKTALALHLADSAAVSDVATGRETAFAAGSNTISEFLSAQKELYATCDNLWQARTSLSVAGLTLLKENEELDRFLGIGDHP
ncbi:MAG: TolC family protein [Fibrobacterota bacterium]|nr:TolC family protein [Fibrobacterota bacterium]QQS04256.1 MAG: TolC family protein [Fibrobacterota bacterium]